MRDGFISVACGAPKLRLADCHYNAEQTFSMMRQAEKAGAKALVLEALKKFNRENKVTIVMVSSELEELRQSCDRIAIVSGGRVAGILPASASVEELGELMLSRVI